MTTGDKIEVKRPGNRRRLSGVVTRIFTNQEIPQVEFRAYTNGGTYLSPMTDVRLYDRTLKKEKESDQWQNVKSKRRFRRPIPDLFD